MPNTSDGTNQEASTWETIDLDNLQKDVESTTEVDLDSKDGDTKEPEIEIEDEVKDSKEESKVNNQQLKVEDVSKKLESRAEKRIRQLVQRTHEKDQENEILRQKLHAVLKEKEEANSSAIASKKTAAEEKVSSYKRELVQAELSGEADKKAEIIDKMQKANVELMAADAALSQQSKQGQTQQGTQPQPNIGSARDQVRSKLPVVGQEWVDKHKWFGVNQELTRQALGLSAEIEQEGFSYDEPEYYEKLEEKLSELYPNRFKSKDSKELEFKPEDEQSRKAEEQLNKPKPVVSSGRAAPTQKPGTVRLTKQEVEQAKRWGIPLKEMARQKQKLERAEKSGDKMTTIFGD